MNVQSPNLQFYFTSDMKLVQSQTVIGSNCDSPFKPDLKLWVTVWDQETLSGLKQ